MKLHTTRYGLLIMIFLLLLLSFACVPVFPEGSEVKFIGVVVEGEELCEEGTCCYGGYTAVIEVTEVLFGSPEYIKEGWEIYICYYEALNLKPGEMVECYGISYATGPCPLQFCGRIVCGPSEEGYYVRRIVALPDLAIENIEYSPVEPSPGDEVVFKIYIANLGSLAAENFYVLARLDGKLFRDFLIEFLDAGEVEILTLEPWIAVSGEHVLEVMVDADNVVPEEDEYNNIKSLKFSVKEEELKPSIFLEVSPTTITYGENISLIFRVENITTVSEVEIAAYKNEALVALFLKETVNENGEYVREAPVNLPPGTYQIIAYLKIDDETVAVSTPIILSVEKITGKINIKAPRVVYPGKEVTINITLQPPRDATGVFTIESPNGTVKEYAFSIENGEGFLKFKADTPGIWKIRIHINGDEYNSDIDTVYKIEASYGREPPQIAQGLLYTTGSIAAGIAITASSSLNFVQNIVARLLKFFKNLIKNISLPEWLRDGITSFLEKVFEVYEEKPLKPPKVWRIITLKEAFSLIISLILTTIVFYYVECNGLPRIFSIYNFLHVMPVVFLTAVMVGVLAEFLEAVIAKTRGIWAEYSLWLHGTLSMILTGFLFYFPFASSATTLYQAGCSEWEEARTSFLKFLIYMFFSAIFATAYIIGFRIIGDTGLMISLMLSSYNMVPLKPLPGRKLYKRSRFLWFFAFLASIVFYASVYMQILPKILYVIFGVFSMLLIILEIATSLVAKRSLIETLLGAPEPPPPPPRF